MSTVLDTVDQLRGASEKQAIYSWLASTLKQHFLSRDSGQAARRLTTPAFGDVREMTVREVAEALQEQADTYQTDTTTLGKQYVK